MHFSVHVLYVCESKPLNTVIVIWDARFEFGFICTFVIDVSQKSYYRLHFELENSGPQIRLWNTARHLILLSILNIKLTC